MQRQEHQQYETIAQAADRCGVHQETLRRRVRDGSLAAHRLGPRLLRLIPAEVDDFLRGTTAVAPDADSTE